MSTTKGVSISLATGVLLAVSFQALRYVSSRSDEADEPVNSSAETEVQRPSLEETDPRPVETLADSVPARSDAGPSWMDKFWGSTDYWELANDAAAFAASGDHRAQYVLARTLGHCDAQVGLYRRLYPDPSWTPEQMIEAAIAKPINRAVPAQLLERGRREFMKCATFFAGQPPALSRLGPDATTQDYWMRRALEGNDPLARLDEVFADVTRLPHLNEESRPALLASIRKGLSAAAASADPEAWYRIGNLLNYVGTPVRSEWPAWVLAACEAGYDCTYSNPAVGNGCVEAGNCASADTLVLQMQREAGAVFGESYARSQEILYAFEQGDGDRVIKEMLDRALSRDVTSIVERRPQ